METSEEDCESWYNFIKLEGNEEAIKSLADAINSVKGWEMMEGYAVFDIEMDFPVSETTAKEMTKLDLNHCYRHRKFNGKLEKIDFGIKESDSNSRKMKRIYKKIGNGCLSDFMSEPEEVDPEDLATDQETSSEEEESESGSSESSHTRSLREKRELLREKIRDAKNDRKGGKKLIKE